MMLTCGTKRTDCSAVCQRGSPALIVDINVRNKTTNGRFCRVPDQAVISLIGGTIIWNKTTAVKCPLLYARGVTSLLMRSTGGPSLLCAACCLSARQWQRREKNIVDVERLARRDWTAEGRLFRLGRRSQFFLILGKGVACCWSCQSTFGKKIKNTGLSLCRVLCATCAPFVRFCFVREITVTTT